MAVFNGMLASAPLASTSSATHMDFRFRTAGFDRLSHPYEFSIRYHQKIKEEIKKDKNTSIKEFDSVRGIFTEGGPAFPGAGVQKKSLIQICIRNINCIKGFFLPRK